LTLFFFALMGSPQQRWGSHTCGRKLRFPLLWLKLLQAAFVLNPHSHELSID